MSGNDIQNGNGSASPNDANRDSQASGGLTEDQAKAVNDIVSKAIGSRFKDFETKQAKAQEKFGENLTATFTATLAQFGEKLDSFKPDPGKGDGKDPKAPENLDEHPRVKGLLKTVEKLEKLNLEREQREAQTAAALKDSKLREKLSGLLSQHGIEGARAQHATGYLVDASKRVAWSEDGETLTFKDDSGDLVDAATGLKSWASSEDGKLYAPPRQASGSGERGQSRQASLGTSNGGKAPSTQELGAGLSAAFGIPIG